MEQIRLQPSVILAEVDDVYKTCHIERVSVPQRIEFLLFRRSQLVLLDLKQMSVRTLLSAVKLERLKGNL